MNSGEGTESPTIQPPNTVPTVAVTDFTVSAEEIASARSAVPVPVESSVGQAIRTAPTTEPRPPAGFSGLTPAQYAGLTLAKFVLWLITLGTRALILSLLAVEYFNFQPYNETIHGVLQLLATSDANASLPLRRAAVATILRAARDQTNPAVPNTDIILVDDFIRTLASSGRLPAEKIKSLETCAAQLHPPSPDSSPDIEKRRTATNTCLDDLDAITVGPALDPQHLQAFRDIGKDALDARQAGRGFWLQVMQLVLLNLLLPTLTALLGYIFGSQQRS